MFEAKDQSTLVRVADIAERLFRERELAEQDGLAKRSK
jgi:hypothetical protein